jgi:acetyltransferase-like isoleucine patch superfamily enzyme
MKAYLLLIYFKLRSLYKRWNYFIYPNLFTRAKYSYASVPNCQQITEITGVGKITIGKNCGFGYRIGGFWRNGSIELQARYTDAEIIIGDNVFTNNNVFICAANKIIIGSNTRIGQGIMITDFEAHGTDPNKRNKVGEIGMVEIGTNVWIGNNVTILKNSKIGKNPIVATGAVVSGEYPENTIIGGIPAKVIKNL